MRLHYNHLYMPRGVPNRPPEPESPLSPEEAEKAAIATRHLKIASNATITLRMDNQDAKRTLFEMLQNPKQLFTADHLFQLLYPNHVITSHTQAEISSYVLDCENILDTLAMRFSGKIKPDLPFTIERTGDAPASTFDRRELRLPRGVYKMTPLNEKEMHSTPAQKVHGAVLRQTIFNSVKVKTGRVLKPR